MQKIKGAAGGGDFAFLLHNRLMKESETWKSPDIQFIHKRVAKDFQKIKKLSVQTHCSPQIFKNIS